MLLLGPASSAPHRIQGSWVSEAEVRKVAGVWKRQAPEMAYDKEVLGTDDGPSGSGGGSGSGRGSDDDDEMLEQAMELIVRSQLGSTSMLQRKLRVGFARAGRLMDLLEQRGVVGPSTGSKARDVLMTTEELEETLAGARGPGGSLED
jgi:S-DNA-T family DNA segregation ATPase FtsK/SpoIIIE